MLFKGFPNECDTLKSLRNGALATGYSKRWATEWEQHALPLFDQVSSAVLAGSSRSSLPNFLLYHYSLEYDSSVVCTTLSLVNFVKMCYYALSPFCGHLPN